MADDLGPEGSVERRLLNKSLARIAPNPNYMEQAHKWILTDPAIQESAEKAALSPGGPNTSVFGWINSDNPHVSGSPPGVEAVKWTPEIVDDFSPARQARPDIHMADASWLTRAGKAMPAVMDVYEAISRYLNKYMPPIPSTALEDVRRDHLSGGRMEGAGS